ESRAERDPVRRVMGVLELLGAREMALHRADHGAPEDLRDACSRLSRIPGLRIRVLHDVRIRAPHVHEARPQNCRHRAAVSSHLIADNTHLITHALILAAGLGTRLRPLTDARAKPAMPVAGEPLIRRITTWLAAGGVSEIVVNLHHRPETLT